MMGLASNLDWTVFAVLVVALLGIDIISRTWQAAAVRRAWMSSAAWIDGRDRLWPVDLDPAGT